MRSFTAILSALSVLVASTSASCTVGPHASAEGVAKASDAPNFHAACATALRNQVRMEFEASLQYLLMGAYFSQVNSLKRNS